MKPELKGEPKKVAIRGATGQPPKKFRGGLDCEKKRTGGGKIEGSPKGTLGERG